MTERGRDWALLISLIGFELAIGAVGLLLAWVLSVPVDTWWPVDMAALGVGILAGAMMFGVLLVLLRLPFEPAVRLVELVRRLVGALFRGRPVLDLLVISAAAGLGEELLFRGFLQQWVATHWGNVAGIGVAAVLFGIAHPISALYALVACLFGAVLGSLVVATGSLWAAVSAHAVYDFLAIMYLVRRSEPFE